MALTRLENLISSKTGRFVYVSPDDFNASDDVNNRGNSPTRPFKSIQRAFLEVSRFSYKSGPDNDRFDEFTVVLSPGDHYIDNRPGVASASLIPDFSTNVNFDLGNSQNDLYKFNPLTGGVIVPRGTSLVGMDLRKTKVRPLYIPNPTDDTIPESSIFNVTGGCYFWQFSIFDGKQKVYFDTTGNKANPTFSHHKITNFTFADAEDLTLYYDKIGDAYVNMVTDIDVDGAIEETDLENRIVGPLSDKKIIESITPQTLGGNATEIKIKTKAPHGYFVGQFVTIDDTGLTNDLHGSFLITRLDPADNTLFYYRVNESITSLISGTTYTTASLPPNRLNENAIVQAEIDTVDSASPYMFNLSIRSTWGLCGMHADGSKVTGFKSMVCAQYTGVSLQKDDRAFTKFNEETAQFDSAWNGVAVTDPEELSTGSFATTPYHTDGRAYFKNEWRNAHVRLSNDAFIQAVSIFAVGFADHFLIESGADISITNSNSNFGNTALDAIGYKGYSFFQDKHGYITDIVPPQTVDLEDTTEPPYYGIDIIASKEPSGQTRVYLSGEPEEISDPDKTPTYILQDYKIGSKRDDRIYSKLEPDIAGGEAGPQEKSAELSPSGFDTFTITTLSTASQSEQNAQGETITYRTTIFTCPEAHGLYTGTPVRLVPKRTSNTIADELVRLPKGLIPNTVYYLISPGRHTQPVPPDQTFPTEDLNTFLLAASEDDAAAGNAIYIPEGLNSGVQIQMFQYIFDVIPTPYKYKITNADPATNEFTLESPHVFDKGFATKAATPVFFRAKPGSQLPGGLDKNKMYYVIYDNTDANTNKFKIAESAALAIQGGGVPFSITSSGTVGQVGQDEIFVFSCNSRHPLRYDPEMTASPLRSGHWYMNVLNTGTQPNTIYQRISSLTEYTSEEIISTSNTYIKRINDRRREDDRIYRLRYVIPKEVDNVREPLLGYVLKIRTDENRRLRPQKVVLEALDGTSDLPTFYGGSPTIDGLGNNLPIQNDFNYDPYLTGNSKALVTDSGIKFTIESARQKTITGINRIELTVVDHTINTNIAAGTALASGTILTEFKLTSVAGGGFITGNSVAWSGFSSSAPISGTLPTVHKQYTEGGNTYVVVASDFSLLPYIKYNAGTSTILASGSGTGILAEKPNGGRDDFKNYDDDLGRQYVIQNAPVYTLTPGDFVRDETDGNQKDYKVVSVEDVDEITNTYYIYRVKTLRKRIYNQQDGIYYLTALRGDFAPSVSEFNSFKFGHPTERLYPELFADDPLWFDPNGDGSTIADAPATISVADNYVHGLVVADDNKNSITREATESILGNIGRFGSGAANPVTLGAMEGKAVASREDRVIGIEGNSTDVADRRFYVELRRPSQARSGNHTFEYTGFGPGNYSTAFPSRQEYVLSDDEVLFSQAKRQDGGVVFYSGLNANGDLFVGNQRINAISGEETKIDDSILRVAGENVDEEENTNDITVDTLTVNNKVKFNLSNDFLISALGGTKFTSPVEIALSEDPFANSSDDPPALKIKSVGNISNPSVDAFLTTTDMEFNPVFKPNSIKFAQWIINPRNETSGLEYAIKTSVDKVVPASESFKQEGTIELRGTQTVGEAHRIANVNYNTTLGWIYTQIGGYQGGETPEYGWREWGVIGADALTTYTTGGGSTANDPGNDMRLGINLRNVRTTNASVIPTQTLDVEGSGIFRNSLWVGGDNLNPTGQHTLRVFDDDGNGIGRVHVNSGETTETLANIGLWVGGDTIIRGSGAGTAPVESVGGGQAQGNLTIDGTFTALSNGSHEMVGDLTVTKDLYVRGGNMKMYQIDSGTDLRIDVQQANTAASSNYISAHGQNIVVGDAIYTNDHFDDASTAKLVALSDGSARIGNANSGIQMTDTSMVSIGSATPDIAQRLWVKGSTKIELDSAELFSVYNQTTPRLTMNKDGRIDLVGSGSLTDPTGRWDANGALSIGNDFLIGKTHINDDATYSIDSQTGNTVIGNDTDNSGTLTVHSNTNSSSKDTGAVIIADGGLGVEGNINAGGDINAGGNISSATGALDINNGGSNNFKVNTDGSIDINQVTGYFTPTGGRKWVGTGVDATLEVNTNYYVTTFGAATLTLTLPSAPQKGDEIRILDTTDGLTYNKSIIVQSPQGGTVVPVQGDSQGQLVIQTPGAGLGLVYLTASIGWRLIEL
tara:strand:+ start:8249 stop:14758 length:6510 start_codon:yes stop_codon:yes gene_type:complete